MSVLLTALLLVACKPAPPGTPVPNVVGMRADKAQHILQQENAYIAKNVDLHDVKPGERSARMVLIKSHWKVCSQAPAAGSPSRTNMTVKLAVVKNGEHCPRPLSVQPPTPSPSRTPQHTAKPSPAATTPPASAGPAAPPGSMGQTPTPAGTCEVHTVAYCGWDEGQTPAVPGETATCNDGTISFSASDGSGTCSGHKGVRVWFK